MALNKADFDKAVQNRNIVANVAATQAQLFGENSEFSLGILSFQSPQQGRQGLNLDLRKGARPYAVTLSDATLAAITADIKASLQATSDAATKALADAGIDINA